MAAVDKTSAASLFKTVYAPAGVSTLFQEDVLFDYPGMGVPESTPGKMNGLFPYKASAGGTGLTWPVHYASDAAREMTIESQAAAAPGRASWTNAAQDYRYFDATLKIYRQTLDACRGEGEVVGVLGAEFDRRLRQLRDTINTTLLGTGTGNLQAIIDATSTYAGISSRATYGFGSSETPVDGALALSDLEDIVEALVLKGVDPNDLVWLIRPNQKTNIMNLGGWSGNSVVQRYTETGGRFDPTFKRSEITACGIPIVESTSVTSTVMMLVHVPSFEWSINVPLDIEELPTTDYAYQWRMLISFMLRCLHPEKCAKLTGVTA